MQRARDDAMEAERIRQRGYQQEADVINARSRDQYQGYEKKQTDRGKELADYFTAQEAVPADKAGPVAMPASDSNITVSAVNQARGEARDFTDRTGKALGELRSFGDLMGEMSRNTARDAGYVGQIGGFMKGSSAVLPYELEAANSTGSGMQMLGDVLGGLGRVGVMAGLSGPPAVDRGARTAASFVPGLSAAGSKRNAFSLIG